MPARKRASIGQTEEPAPKRRSLRQAAKACKQDIDPIEGSKTTAKDKAISSAKATPKALDKPPKPAKALAPVSKVKSKKQQTSPTPPKTSQPKKPASKRAGETKAAPEGNGSSSARAVSEDPDPSALPTTNPDAPRHDGEWYWLMKAEPESRFENGVDVSFSIDDLWAKDKPEGWDGVRNFASRNNMRNMNAGDKAFFYHSSCKEPGIVGVMEIVKEYSEDKSARRPGTPYYDASSTKDKPKWGLVHVEFRKKFAVQIGLKELRELAKSGGPLENMQMLKQTRLSVSRVSAGEWKALCEIADRKAEEAGLEHEV